jgi:hypothetical protein
MRHTSVLLALSLLAPLTLAASASAQDQSSEVQVMDFLDGDQVDRRVPVGPMGGDPPVVTSGWVAARR